jgi:voltage-gated potassium channel
VRASVIGRFGELLIAEAPVMGTPLGRQAIGESRSCARRPGSRSWASGSAASSRSRSRRRDDAHHRAGAGRLGAQLARFAELTCDLQRPEAPGADPGRRPGGPRGRAAPAARDPLRIVEKDPARIRDDGTYVLGSAADLEVLEKAGIREAPTAIVTTNDDATNIYLTIYCRRLRPDIQIVSRATLERNVSTLHRAGADFVMSYASMGANAIYNVLEQGDVVMLAEGLTSSATRSRSPLAGRPLARPASARATGCSVVAIETPAGPASTPSPPTSRSPPTRS